MLSRSRSLFLSLSVLVPTRILFDVKEEGKRSVRDERNDENEVERRGWSREEKSR
jgi:hypothetical protein